jgi:hypothetical protein
MMREEHNRTDNPNHRWNGLSHEPAYVPQKDSALTKASHEEHNRVPTGLPHESRLKLGWPKRRLTMAAEPLFHEPVLACHTAAEPLGQRVILNSSEFESRD